MPRFRTYFTLVFWSLFLLIVAVVLYQKGNAQKQQCTIVKGIVIDQISVTKTSLHRGGTIYGENAMRPQIVYPVGDSQYMYVDHNTSLHTGATPQIIYYTNNPRNARVYNLGFWIDFGIVVPAFLIAALFYRVVLIARSKDNSTEVLPSNSPL